MLNPTWKPPHDSQKRPEKLIWPFFHIVQWTIHTLTSTADFKRHRYVSLNLFKIGGSKYKEGWFETDLGRPLLRSGIEGCGGRGHSNDLVRPVASMRGCDCRHWVSGLSPGLGRTNVVSLRLGHRHHRCSGFLGSLLLLFSLYHTANHKSGNLNVKVCTLIARYSYIWNQSYLNKLASAGDWTRAGINLITTQLRQRLLLTF